MKKAIVIPDSFKGTLSSKEICDVMAERIIHYYPNCEVIAIPVADGGEGSVEAFIQVVGGDKISCLVNDPFMAEMESYYGILKDGKTAIIEMAACAGLSLVGSRKNPSITTTFGVGQLIAHAIGKGIENIVLALGGSATNDGGCGMAAALGVEFIDSEGKNIIPTGESLHSIKQIKLDYINPGLKNINLMAMCDVINPLCGDNGAAVVFGPQKGADETMVRELDSGLAHMASLVNDQLGIDICNLSGAGAAGGMGGGAVAFLGATLKSGIETLLKAVDFDELALDADFVFTGEGRIDSQSMQGKVVDGVAKHSKRLGVPVIVIAGDISDNIEGLYEIGVTAIMSTNRIAAPYQQIVCRAKSDISLTMDTFLRIISI